MKTINSNLLIALAIALGLSACISNKSNDTKTSDSESVSMSMIAIDPEPVEESPLVETATTIKFVPPTIAQDEKMSVNDDVMSISEVRGVELREHKDIRMSEIRKVDKQGMAAAECYPATPQAVYHSEEYASFTENIFSLAADNPLSTFSADVDGASYSNTRRYLNQGQIPHQSAIRVEEFVNYFKYKYPNPTGADPVYISTEVGVCPWNAENRLVKIGLKAREIPTNELPKSNFVFLIDVSGSMSGPTRIDLVKSSMKLLLTKLRSDDRVAIVTYANGVHTRMESTPASNKAAITKVLDGLVASGGTSGGDGIIRAYKIAEQNFIKGGNNRIILCTDGDFNVGMSSDSELEKMIEEKRKTGVYLSILGYGMGNYKDKKMQTLSQAGNGNHAYIDNIQEANKVLVQEFASTMYTVAKDVKLQVEFNPGKVLAYRLVGYETRKLNKEDFNNDAKDAGEMGAGHTVTALYEVIPVGVKSNVIGSVDPLKYQTEPKKDIASAANEMLTVKMRYKQPDGNVSKKLEKIMVDRGGDDVSGDFRFAASVAMFAQILRGSEYKGDGSYDKVIASAKKGLDNDEEGYRREFIRLVETTKGLSN